MGKKPRIDPGSTYVLDEKDVEELDDLTLTTVIRDVATTVDKEDEEAKEHPPDLDDLEFDGLVSKD